MIERLHVKLDRQRTDRTVANTTRSTMDSVVSDIARPGELFEFAVAQTG